MQQNEFVNFYSYNTDQNEIKLINDYTGQDDREKTAKMLHKIILGDEKASEEGEGVFEFLRRKVLK